jgi:hypothetical protein
MAPAHFALVIFVDRALQTVCSGWLTTAILLISASQVARIIGVSYQCPVPISLIYADSKLKLNLKMHSSGF